MSLCNVCPDPGHCCKIMEITLPGEGEPYKEPSLALANARFVQIPQVAVGHSYNGCVLFECPLLSDEGRCTDYENRPKMCGENYPPMLDGLCVFYGRIHENEDAFIGEGIA